MNTEKKLIVVTGGAGGIGQACARALKDQPIVITDYSHEMVNKTVETLASEGFDVTGIACDITDKKDIEKLINYVDRRGSLKALIHAAGVSGAVNDLKKVYTINLLATELLVHAFSELAVKDTVAILLSSMKAHTIPANKEYDEALTNPQAPESFDIVSRFLNNNSDIMYNFTIR